MRVLQQRIDDLSKQLKEIQDEQAKTTKTVSAHRRGDAHGVVLLGSAETIGAVYRCFDEI
jgi:hypothetical protein